MISNKLKDRIASYAEVSNHKLMNRLPVIITINGRAFTKFTSLLDKPYSQSFSETMCSTLIRLVQEIDGSVFGYTFNDEIIIVSRNDHTLETVPWYDNNIQKIVSVVSSIVTLHFNNYATSIELNTIGDPIFIVEAFTVPNIMEAINVIVSKQQQNFQGSIQLACLYELLKKGYNKNDIKEMLSGNLDEKIDLLKQECNIDFNQYPLAFRRGAACYRSRQVINYEGNDIIKNKWTLNVELPIFTKEHAFLQNIFKTGADIFRKDS